MDKLQTNMNAAKLLGREMQCLEDNCDGRGTVTVTSFDTRLQEYYPEPAQCVYCYTAGSMSVDIFTNPADCLAVVKMLSLKYDINIYSDCGKWFSNAEADKRTEFDTYEGAVAVAVNEVMKDED